MLSSFISKGKLDNNKRTHELSENVDFPPCVISSEKPSRSANLRIEEGSLKSVHVHVYFFNSFVSSSKENFCFLSSAGTVHHAFVEVNLSPL